MTKIFFFGMLQISEFHFITYPNEFILQLARNITCPPWPPFPPSGPANSFLATLKRKIRFLLIGHWYHHVLCKLP